MIKRLKWNVIHYDDVDDAQQTSSDESEPEAQTLRKLMDNDPDLNALRPATHADQPRSESPPVQKPRSHPPLRAHGAADSANDQGESQSDASAHPDEERADAEQQGAFHEWKECVLCSKRFYNDNDVQSHLSSKRHEEALRKQNEQSSKLNKRPQQVVDTRASGSTTTPKSPSASDEAAVQHKNRRASRPSVDNELTQQRRTEEPRRARSKRKKAAAKRKLRALKRRKWEKQRQSVTDNVTNA